MKIISLFLLALTLSACTGSEDIAWNPAEEPAEESATLETFQQTIDFSFYLEGGYTDLSHWPVDEVDWEDVDWPVPLQNFHKDQVTDFYSIGDVTFALVGQPNAWTAMESVRAWEEAGNTAWSGVLVKSPKADWEIFFQAPEDDFNPVGLYLEEEQLVLELADDSGAGSGEGVLIRYVYPFAGVADELLNTWVKEECDGYYIPELYADGIKAETDFCSPVVN